MRCKNNSYMISRNMYLHERLWKLSVDYIVYLTFRYCLNEIRFPRLFLVRFSFNVPTKSHLNKQTSAEGVCDRASIMRYFNIQCSSALFFLTLAQTSVSFLWCSSDSTISKRDMVTLRRCELHPVEKSCFEPNYLGWKDHLLNNGVWPKRSSASRTQGFVLK